jgi:DNA-binding MarR family transcriptional regulator
VHTLERRSVNLTGALAVALSDRLGELLASDSAALVTLAERGPLTIEFLRNVIGLSHSATVRLVDRLGRAHLVERRVGPDARSVSVALTVRGRGRAAALQQRRAQTLTAALAALDRRQRREFTVLVEKILGGLTSGRRQARFTCRLCDHGACRASSGCPVDEAATALGL